MAYVIRTRTVEIEEKVHHPEWYDLLLSGQKIEAIKAFRNTYGTDLKTSKAVIDGFTIQTVSERFLQTKVSS